MSSQVQCPKCKNFKTAPDPSLAREHDFALIAQAFGFGRGYSFENPRYLTKFTSGAIRAKCEYCGLIFDVNTRWDAEQESQPLSESTTPEARLEVLARLLSKGLITEEEHTRKRDEILRNL